jgi:hypothetical protein
VAPEGSVSIFRRSAPFAVLVIALSGCVTAAPTAAPSALVSPESSPAASVPSVAEAWTDVGLGQPSAVLDAPSLAPGYLCHPCHFLAENQLFGVGATASGFVAVGVQQPPSQAVAFSSTDGVNWGPLGNFNGESGSAAVAVAGTDHVTVIVGHDTSGAVSWASTGSSNGSWTRSPRQADLQIPYEAGGMTAVTVAGDGFVAGGYRDDPLHARAHAAVWRSNDGLTWHLDPSAPVFDGGRIAGIAAAAGSIIAVGTDGDPNYGPAAAWLWTAAEGWRRANLGPDETGAMRAVTATATGFVAVGLNGQDTGARVWTSTDGLVWTVVPDQPAFHYFDLPVRMQSVAMQSGGLVAGGWRSDAGKGSAVTWTSQDGRTWEGPLWESGFSGGQIDGVASAGGTVVAVGRTGYPDWNTATIWRAAAP